MGSRPAGAAPFRIGVISDTHGILPPEAEAALAGVDAIVHAGDVGEGYILETLAAIAPVTAVRGNNRYASERDLPDTVITTLGGVLVSVAHKAHHVVRYDLRSRETVRLGICGHTHKAAIWPDGDVLMLNPGSPSEPRGGTPPFVAIVTVEPDGAVLPELVRLRP